MFLSLFGLVLLSAPLAVLFGYKWLALDEPDRTYTCKGSSTCSSGGDGEHDAGIGVRRHGGDCRWDHHRDSRSLAPLARESAGAAEGNPRRVVSSTRRGAPTRARTWDLRIKSP